MKTHIIKIDKFPGYIKQEIDENKHTGTWRKMRARFFGFFFKRYLQAILTLCPRIYNCSSNKTSKPFLSFYAQDGNDCNANGLEFL